MSGEVFAALRVAPLLGRAFTQEEDEQQQPVAVLSYGMWRSRFQGTDGFWGHEILLDRKPYLMIGVMPRNFEFPLVTGQLNHRELWVPLSFTPGELGPGAGNWSFQMVGRLKPGIGAGAKDAEGVAQEIMRNLRHKWRACTLARGAAPGRGNRRQARPLVHTLFLAVVVVLFIACANLAGLLLVRVIRSEREISVRLALGEHAAAASPDPSKPSR